MLDFIIPAFVYWLTPAAYGLDCVWARLGLRLGVGMRGGMVRVRARVRVTVRVRVRVRVTVTFRVSSAHLLSQGV